MCYNNIRKNDGGNVMNKKNIVTAKNIAKVADFLEEACEHFKNQGEGGFNLNLSEDLVLAVGWSDGYDMADEDIIKSKEGQRQNGNWTCGWAVNAAIKVRNDFDCADFDFLNYPYFEETGDCADCGMSMRPNQSRREYRKDARWFLETFVSMTNAIDRGELCID